MRDALSEEPEERESLAKESSPHRAVATAWLSLAEQMQAGSVLHESTPRLADYAFNRFDPKAVIERLLSPEPTYFAHKDILFAGLSAWTVAPQYPHLVREAMILAGMSRLADLERKRQREFPQDPLLADTMSRLVGPGVDFYRDFYYPAGGLRRIIEARSPALMRRSLIAASKNIGFQVEMMRICHYHAERLQDREKFRKASFKSSSGAMANLIKQGAAPWVQGYHTEGQVDVQRTIDSLNCKKKSSPFIPTAPLIYAASSIDLQGETLLSAFSRGNIDFKDNGHHLRSWIDRAIYAGTKVISPMYSRDSTESQIGFLPSTPAAEIPTPDFGMHARIIDDAYRL